MFCVLGLIKDCVSDESASFVVCIRRARMALPLTLRSPSCFYVCGATGSGKSRLVARIIRNRREMFKKCHDAVHYAYKEWQPLFDDLQNKESVRFHEGLPTLDQIRTWAQKASGNGIILVVDDLALEATASNDMAVLVSVISHHCDVTVFF